MWQRYPRQQPQGEVEFSHHRLQPVSRESVIHPAIHRSGDYCAGDLLLHCLHFTNSPFKNDIRLQFGAVGFASEDNGKMAFSCPVVFRATLFAPRVSTVEGDTISNQTAVSSIAMMSFSKIFLELTALLT